MERTAKIPNGSRGRAAPILSAAAGVFALSAAVASVAGCGDCAGGTGRAVVAGLAAAAWFAIAGGLAGARVSAVTATGLAAGHVAFIGSTPASPCAWCVLSLVCGVGAAGVSVRRAWGPTLRRTVPVAVLAGFLAGTAVARAIAVAEVVVVDQGLEDAEVGPSVRALLSASCPACRLFAEREAPRIRETLGARFEELWIWRSEDDAEAGFVASRVGYEMAEARGIRAARSIAFAEDLQRRHGGALAFPSIVVNDGATTRLIEGYATAERILEWAR